MIEIKREPAAEKCCRSTPSRPASAERFTGCLLCGKELVYETRASRRRCAICGKEYESNSACADGHYVCDACHAASSIAFFAPFLLGSSERDPLQLLEQMFALPQVHMHGPEHHAIVPCVLLTAYRNSGGELDLEAALREAVRRAGQVPGGACGYWGVCGAAAGAGIYMSVLLDSNPLHKEMWPIPQRLTAECLEAIADVGGPRCCKRTCRLAVERAAAFTAERLGVSMPVRAVNCRYRAKNRECILRACPYFPGN